MLRAMARQQNWMELLVPGGTAGPIQTLSSAPLATASAASEGNPTALTRRTERLRFS